MKSLGQLTIAIYTLSCVGFSTVFTTLNAQSYPDEIVENISATIDKDTTDEDFDNIAEMLSEYGIEATFNKINRNENNEITGIALTLRNGKSTSKSSFSSNSPIAQMTFGSKNGQLYISRGKGNGDIFAFFNNNSFGFPFENDSLMEQYFGNIKQFSLNDWFSSDGGGFLFEGDSMDIDAFKDKILKRFNLNNNGNNSFSYFFDNDDGKKNSTSGTYRFIDDPEKNKLIVIDGEISDFETLNKLAKNDKLNKVDVLNPETAMSIYGEKAKDGAIIATTK